MKALDKHLLFYEPFANKKYLGANDSVFPNNVDLDTFNGGSVKNNSTTFCGTYKALIILVQVFIIQINLATYIPKIN